MKSLVAEANEGGACAWGTLALDETNKRIFEPLGNALPLTKSCSSKY